MDPVPVQDEPRSGQVTLRYWASLRAAAGVSEDRIEVSGPVPLAEVIARAVALRGSADRFTDVLATCSVLVGDRPVASADPATVVVEPGVTVEFLPPFAGG